MRLWQFLLLMQQFFQLLFPMGLFKFETRSSLYQALGVLSRV
jgi:hypothetical protein